MRGAYQMYNYEARWKRVAEVLNENEMDAYVVSLGANIRYLSCAHISSAPIYNNIIIDSSGNVFGIVSSLEEFRVRDEGSIEEIYIFAPYEGIDAYAPKSIEAIKKLLESKGYRRIMSDSKLDELKDFEIRVEDIIKTMRVVKDSDEINAIKRAADIAIKAQQILEDEILMAGKSEREVARALNFALSELGSQLTPFPPIIASGPKHSAYPHHDPTDRKISKGDVVICDFGAIYNGYVSDMTRTYFIGDAKGDLKDIYDTVLEAQELAIRAISHGENYGILDDAARRFIKEKGMARYFVHSLGHGIGLEVHEEPLGIRHESKEVITPGNAFTIEPGIYIPEVGGVRIEDDVIITEDGYKIITRL